MLRRGYMRSLLVLLLLVPCACGGIASSSAGAPPGDSGGDSGSDSGGGSQVDSGVVAFPVGTYTNCAQGVHNPPGLFLNSAGFQSGAALTLVQSGATVHATYVDQNGSTSSLDFTVTSSTSATLASPAQVAAQTAGFCVHGPGNEDIFPAPLSASAGGLGYDANTVFLSLTGTLDIDAGSCGPESSPADFWIVCGGGQGAAPSPPPQAAADAHLPLGQYTCSSQLAVFDEVGGVKEYVVGGSEAGTLSLAQSGAEVTVQYTGDTSVGASLRFLPTTDTSAFAEAGQSLSVPCLVPLDLGGGGPPQTLQTLPVAAGSLSVNDSTLVLSFFGTMGADSTCPGAQTAGSLLCAKQ